MALGHQYHYIDTIGRHKLHYIMSKLLIKQEFIDVTFVIKLQGGFRNYEKKNGRKYENFMTVHCVDHTKKKVDKRKALKVQLAI